MKANVLDINISILVFSGVHDCQQIHLLCCCDLTYFVWQWSMNDIGSGSRANNPGVGSSVEEGRGAILFYFKCDKSRKY